jgi:SAM-dependent methyltransferase
VESPFRAEHFSRLDETPDTEFYSFPRKVVHIDEAAIMTVKQVFREVLPAHGVVLDLLSSWRSHWPEGLAKQRLIGLGLNAEEMADNPDLDEYVVHDVNAHPQLPFASAMFDAVLLTVSIQYLTQPVAVFRDVNRLLKPGGPFVVVFSNRMFPTKAVAIWRMLNDQQHADLIAAYFQQAGNFVEVAARDYTPAALAYTDPVYVVMARKGASAAGT